MEQADRVGVMKMPRPALPNLAFIPPGAGMTALGQIHPISIGNYLMDNLLAGVDYMNVKTEFSAPGFFNNEGGDAAVCLVR